ncbi:hypothetical protein LX16_0728 [Stackebrandtia albiflava]|uniref:Tetratricopeptide repeat protein n=1 Tax=Stackebrandtia albiflava TaxID=406432 RepID=A0A562VB13_9ACTN|nr:hypothetical protein [Stackebrandtia albiflava]TWJ15031.1 hypothetical protein LX16_0728 [Stackebrandtia albiflava]
MTPPTVETIRRAMADNRGMPNGEARNAHAESIVDQADALGDQPTVTEALITLIEAYEYSAESHKLLVPFARLLRRYDTAPEHYDDEDVSGLFWYFKWATGGMLDNPDVPLAAVEHWLAEMRRRYTQAGYGMHAVLKEEWWIADHVGDTARAGRAFTEWRSTERDRMSDCLACDHNAVGEHLSHRSDAEALEAWRPVLEGDLRCAEEPHRILADSLLPLTRLGRVEEARANHLRGYRMVRGDDSLATSVAMHIEFCALTGNEARALEILAEHRRHIDGIRNAGSRRRFLEGVAVLLGRLTDSGRGDVAVPGPGDEDWTAARLRDVVLADLEELWRRFDARNGSDSVSGAGRARLAVPPFAEPLPLGVTTATPATMPVTAAAPPVTAEPPARAEDLPALIAEATALTEAESPDARDAWLRIDRLATGAGVPLEPLAEAAAISARGRDLVLTDLDTALALWRRAAELYTDNGRPDMATIRETWILTAQALHDEPVLADVDELLRSVRRSHETGTTPGRVLAIVLVSRALLEVTAATHDSSPERLTETLHRLAEWQAELPGGEDDRPSIRRHLELMFMRAQVLHLLGDAEELHRTGLAAWELAVRIEDGSEQVRAAALIVGRVFAESGAEEAIRIASTALAADTRHEHPHQVAELHLASAQIRMSLAEWDPALSHARDAGDRYERVGNDAAAAFSRHLVGVAYLEKDRPAEAATVLESVLPELDASEPEAAFNARNALCRALLELEEPQAAAEVAAVAAAACKDDPEPSRYAHFASMAAEALLAAGETEAAAAAAGEAARAWRQAGHLPNVAKLGRLHAGAATDEATASRELLAVVEELTTALVDPEQPSENLTILHRERGLTYREAAHVLWRRLDEDESTDLDGRGEVLRRSREAYRDFEAAGDVVTLRWLDADLVWQLAEAGDAAGAAAHAASALDRWGTESGVEDVRARLEFARDAVAGTGADA